MKILITGGDSRLSKYLEYNLKINHINFLKTSRRGTPNTINLNFENTENFIIPNEITHAVIVGGVTSYDDCENKYDYAYKINCIKIPNLISDFLKKNIFVIYISTNTVFKYDFLPKEDDLPSPAFPYAKLKYISESKITKIVRDSNMEHKFSILRLTKNVCEKTPPFNNWIDSINNNKPFKAFKDLYFAPITFNHSSEAILKIIIENKSGIFHLSGEKDISYSEFGLDFIKFLKLNSDICQSVNSADIGVNLKYNHFITALGMEHSIKQLNINPVSVKEVYNYLSKFIK